MAGKYIWYSKARPVRVKTPLRNYGLKANWNLGRPHTSTTVIYRLIGSNRTTFGGRQCECSGDASAETTTQ